MLCKWIQPILVLTILAAGCDLFSPRDAESPTQESTTSTPATTPEVLIANFRSAIEQKNIYEYEKTFSDQNQGVPDYRFVPSQTAASTFQDKFLLWSKESEREYLRRVLAKMAVGSIPRLAIHMTQTTRFQSDSAMLTTDYALFVNHTDPLLPVTFSGRMMLYMIPSKTTGLWVIYRWEDYETSPDSSWSRLKGYFGQ